MRQVLSVALAAGLMMGLVSRGLAKDEMREILEKAIKAHGGEKLAKYSAYITKSKGKIDMLGGITYTQESSVQLPDKYKVVMNVQIQGKSYNVTTGYNGKEGWLTLDGKVQKLGDKLNGAFKQGAYMMNVGHLIALRDKKFQLAPLGEIKVNNRPAVGIRVSSKGMPDASLYFDAKTWLLVKEESRTHDFLSNREYTGERIITEHQAVDGLKAAKKVIAFADGKKLVEEEVTEIKFLEKLDDSEFAKP
jgi:hypothetical protein